MEMRLFASAICVLLLTHHAAAQAPLRTIQDGALDRIELFVASIKGPAARVVIVKPFETSAADLGTGGNDGKEARQQEARTMKNEGPRVLAERLGATLEKGGRSRACGPPRPRNPPPKGP
jgi:hypothetical protein